MHFVVKYKYSMIFIYQKRFPAQPPEYTCCTKKERAEARPLINSFFWKRAAINDRVPVTAAQKQSAYDILTCFSERSSFRAYRDCE